MNVETVKLINFRNYLNLDIELNKAINVFIGKNAQGKTNFLEAIYVCATGNSFRTNSDREMINFKKEEAYIGANMNLREYKRFIEVKLDRQGPKKIRINKNLLENQRELDSGLNVVVFSPDDLSLVKEGPSKRRDFLDREISQISPLYSHNLSKYNRVMYQRNNILKSKRPIKEKIDLLEIFDFQLANFGSRILFERREYVKKLSKIAKKIHKNVTNDKEELTLEYIPSFNLLGEEEVKEIEEIYLRELKASIERDLEVRNTGIGPHREDMLVKLNGQDLRVYGSQGQQRTAVLSIKLSEVDLIKQEKGNFPVLLLDDVFSELDRERRKFLIDSLKEIQTIITVTDTLNLEEMEEVEKSVFHVSSGEIIRADN